MQSHHLHTAEILLGLDDGAPLTGGCVVVDDAGTVIWSGHRAGLPMDSFETHTAHALLMPGVVNCHTHLTDAGIPRPLSGGSGLNDWVLRLQEHRRENRENTEDLLNAVADELDRMRASGTVAVGEVSGNFMTLPPIANSGMRCRFMLEQIAFASDRAGQTLENADAMMEAQNFPVTVDCVLSAHAPYSVSPALMNLLAARNRERGTFLYQHLAEDPDERELYMTGGGGCRDLLDYFNAWDPAWKVPGKSPIQLYAEAGVLGPDFVAVHLTDATKDEIALLARHKARAILCPRANLHITGRLPDLEQIVRQGIDFGLGTDGRGCTATPDVFDDARALFERYYDLKPGIFLQALCNGGAGILQMEDVGSFKPGARPGLLSVELERVTEDIARLEEQVLTSAVRTMHNSYSG